MVNVYISKDELHNRIVNKTHHAVVFFGEFIIDILYSDKVFRTKDYIEQLEKLSDDEIMLIDGISRWYDVNGKTYTPTIEDLKNYKFRRDVKNYAYRLTRKTIID